MSARHRSRCAAGIAVLVWVASSAAAGAGAVQADSAVLRVGTSGDYAPFSFHDDAGQLSGFDITVAQRLAADLGRRVEFVTFSWPTLTDQLRAGTFDLVMSGVTVRADRALHMAFTRPYAETGAVAVIRAGDRKKYRRLRALDARDVRIAVNRGGHLEHVARATFPHAWVTAIANNTELPALLRAGRADAVISDELEARLWPAAEFVRLAPFSRDRKAYAVAPRAVDLLPQIDAWLAAREADGWLNQLRRQWLGTQTLRTPQEAGVRALIAAMALRLQLMPFVAAVKRREHLPIADPAQEARVLEHVRGAASAAGLEPDSVAQFFRVQMEAAKLVEERDPAEPIAIDNVSLPDLRAAVARVSNQLIAELGRCRLWLADEHLDAQVRDGLGEMRLPPRMLDDLSAALRHVRAAR